MRKVISSIALFSILVTPAFAKFSSDELTGTTKVTTPTLALSGTGTITGLDSIDSTGEATLEGVLDLQDLQGAVTDSQVPNSITIDLATLATTATSLAGNGTNASSGNAILGVDAYGNAEGAFDVATQSELDALSSVYQPLDSDLTSIAGNTTGGFLTRTASNTYTARTIGEGTAIDVSNGDGVSGAPSIAFDATELTGDRTWADGGASTIGWTYDLSGTDPVLTAVSGGFQITGSLSVPGAGTNSERFGSGSLASGTEGLALGYGATAGHNQAIVIGSGAASSIASTIQIGIAATTPVSNSFVAGSQDYPMDLVQFGKGYRNFTATAYTLAGTHGFGTDRAGGDLNLAGGKGTGAGTPGNVVIQTSTTAGSSSTLQSYATRGTFNASGLTLPSLTSGRVTFASTGGLLADDADLTFSTDTLTVTKLGATTLTGNATLSENTSIALDPAGSADGKYTGITVTGTAGAALAFGDLVVLDVTDSRWELADANSAAGADGDARAPIGICVLSAAGDGSATNILLNGIVRADTAFPSFTVAAPVYVSEAAGDLTSTQPTTTDAVIMIVGRALTADEIYFDPDNTWTTHT